ncbi:MAG TPA: cysteine desulfurase-like protein [Candidatus Saccharimonadales bacterium]|nr:cysteine desulfurase-like protein [Candidatus Saccharimonadales bacterium]
MATESASVEAYDPSRVRTLFPALADGYAYLDGAAGTQVPESVIEAISNAYRSGLSNTDGAFPSSRRADQIVSECRQAVADLVGGDPAGVVLGPNMTTLTYRLAFAMAKDWKPGDEVVVSRLDHDANVRPWIQAAARAGATVRWAEIDTSTGELPTEQYRELVGERTKLVAFTAASNLLGTRPDVAAITEIVHAAGALAYVDGVHATVHGPVDVRDMAADFYTTSAYKWCGPHIGAVIGDPALLERIEPDKLVPAPDYVPDRFETGTPPFADYAGVSAAVDHLAGLASRADQSRRRQLVSSMTAVESFEAELFSVLLGGLEEMDHITVYGRAQRRAPTAYFTVADHDPWEVAVKLAERKINVWSGDNYAWEVTRALGISDDGCAVRAGLVHYNDHSDVDRLLEALAALKE